MSAKYTFLAWDTAITNAPLKLALLQLANNADDDGFSYYSISKMSIACGMSERSFMRKIKDLEEMKILTVERRANRPSLYTLIGDEMGVTLCHLQSAEVTGCHGEVTESHLVGDRESHDPNSTPNTYPESIKTIVESEIQQADPCKVAFDYFWLNMKMRKSGDKKKSLASFKKACNNTDHMNFAIFLVNDTVARFNNQQQGFDRLLPPTYLNGRRWEDEYVIDKPMNQSTQTEQRTQEQTDNFANETKDLFARSQVAKQRIAERKGR